jgi:hypothetical protein
MTQSFRQCIAVVAFGLALAGCGAGVGGSSADDNLSRFLVAPDRFSLYNCQALADKATETAARQKELEALMAKAGPDGAGPLASSIAYRPEYLELTGDMNEMRRTAAAKNCKFVPGVDNPKGQASDKVIR